MPAENVQDNHVMGLHFHLPPHELATWYHSGGALLARDWFTGTPGRGEKWSARGRTGTACRWCRRTLVRMTS